MKEELFKQIMLAMKCAQADLEGVMPEVDPSGDRTHSGWQTIKDLKKAINKMKREKPHLIFIKD